MFRRCNGAKGSENIKKRPASFENKCTPKYLGGSSSRRTLGLGRDSDRCVYPGGVRQDQKACTGFFWGRHIGYLCASKQMKVTHSDQASLADCPRCWIVAWLPDLVLDHTLQEKSTERSKKASLCHLARGLLVSSGPVTPNTWGTAIMKDYPGLMWLAIAPESTKWNKNKQKKDSVFHLMKGQAFSLSFPFPPPTSFFFLWYFSICPIYLTT